MASEIARIATLQVAACKKMYGENLFSRPKKRFCREIKVFSEKVSWEIDSGNFDMLHVQVSVWITAKWAKIYWLTSLLALTLNVRLTWSRNITNLGILEEITRSLLHRYTARWSPLGIFPKIIWIVEKLSLAMYQHHSNRFLRKPCQ